MANNLTLTSAVYDTATPKYGAAALSGGYGLCPQFLTAADFTVELWIKTTSTATQVCVGQNDASGNGFWLGTISGNAVLVCGGPISTGPAVNDGNWHHLAGMISQTTGSKFFVDGVLAVTNATNYGGNGSGAQFAVRNFGGPYLNNYPWSGEVDEVALWNSKKYTANFTPAPIADGTAGLLAVWHLNSNGNDTASSVAAVAPNNAGLVYSPGNWRAASATDATTVYAGAYLRTLFTGNTCVLNFDTSHAGSIASQIKTRIDNGPWVTSSVAGTVALAIPTATVGNSDTPYHALELVVKSVDSSAGCDHWNAPIPGVAIVFTGLTLDSTATLLMPVVSGDAILVFGDSIVAGIRTLGEALANPPDNDDGEFAWAFELRRLLGVEVGVIGLGGTGYTTTYGNAPVFGSSLSAQWSGVARSFPAVKLVLVNHGTNDGGANTTALATTAVNALLAACPNAKIVLMRPLPNASQAGFLAAVPAACNAPSRVSYLDSTGFFNTGFGVDSSGLHPSGANGVMRVAPRVAAALKPLVWPVAGASSPLFRSMRLT